MEKRNTIQKKLVLETVRKLHSHPSAEQVYDCVSAEHPTISKATVYRNLNSLVEDGLLQKIAMPCEADRFDDTVEEHYHLRCLGCNQVMDLPMEYQRELNEKAAQNSECTIEAHNLLFIGWCKHCK